MLLLYFYAMKSANHGGRVGGVRVIVADDNYEKAKKIVVEFEKTKKTL